MAEECTHECSSCGESGCSDRTAQGPSTIETNSRSNIKHVIGVVSGKGGVGKSLVTSLLVTVSAPQELVAMIVGKAVNLAHDMNVELLGLVENMAYFECPDCGKRHHIFGDPQGAAVAERYDIPAYATLPIDPSFARLCDAGKVEDYDVAGALDPIIAQIEAAKQD